MFVFVQILVLQVCCFSGSDCDGVFHPRSTFHLLWDQNLLLTDAFMNITSHSQILSFIFPFQCGLSWALQERSSSFSSSWCFWSTSLIAGMSPGWRRWRRGTLVCGTSVSSSNLESRWCDSVHTDKCCLFFELVLLALLSTTVFNYILSFTATVLFFFLYAKTDGCLMNKFFISVNLIFCLAASVVSVLQKVQVEITFR